MEEFPFRNSKKRYLALSITTATSIYLMNPSVALAQDGAQPLEEITATGSRIRATTGFTQPTPVTRC